MFIHLAISTGMSIEEVREQFDFPRLIAYNKYAKKNPAVHLMLSNFLGYNTPEEPKVSDEESTQEFISQLMGLFPEAF